MEERKLTKKKISEAKKQMTTEDWFNAKAYFDLAAWLGRAIRAAKFQAEHAEYDPSVTWNPLTDPVDDDKRTKEFDSLWEKSSVPHQDDIFINSGEGNLEDPDCIRFQMEQIMAFFYPPVYDLLKSSALAPMFSLALHQFKCDISDPEAEDISDGDKKKAVMAWVVSRRAFAVRHPDETLYILNLTDNIRGSERVAPPSFRQMDKTDEEFVTETCKYFASDFDFPKLSQLRHDGKATIPTSMAFWRQGEVEKLNKDNPGAAKKMEIKGVYTKPENVSVYVHAYDPATRKALKITGFDKVVQATIGRLIQKNNGKPVTINIDKFFRECAMQHSGASVSETSVQATIESLERQRKGWGSVLYTDQLDAFLKNKDPKELQEDFDYSVSCIDGPLISAERVRSVHVSPNGQKVDCVYTFSSYPIMYRYSYGFKQILETESKYISDALPKCTPENLAFAYYIITQINYFESMKGKSSSYTGELTFQTIADRSGYDIESRQKLRNFQAKIFKYCENLVALGKIKNVDRYYRGKTYAGIKITV